MQLMPGTARDSQVVDRFNIQQNIDAGTRHLKILLDRFEGDVRLVIAAYNAGTGAVTDHGGITPYPETQRFVSKDISAWQKQQKDQRWSYDEAAPVPSDSAPPPRR